MRKRIVVIAASLAAITALSACGESAAATHELSKQQFVNDYGFSEEYWPWTSDETTITCKDHDAVVMTIDDTDYPLNGHAKEFDYAEGDLNSVWLDDPAIDGLKVNTGDYDHVALGFCGIDAPSLNDPYT